MHTKLILLASLFSASSGLRKRTGEHVNKAEAGEGSVAKLYTYGSPHVSNPALKNRASSDGCFSGYRVVNIKDEWVTDDVDIVPSLLTFTFYDHSSTPTLELDIEGKSNLLECGESKFRVRSPSSSLHDKEVYIDRSTAYGDGGLAAASAVGLATSYMADLSEVKKVAHASGWTLIGTASNGEDVSHLFQHETTLECQVTFEGSDSFDDWVTDAAIVRVSFCGLDESVHLGFRNEVRRITGASSWQSNIRPKLTGCSSVWSVGHSLGGAQASLFAACANSGSTGDSDYEQMGWSTGTPTKYPSL